MPSPQHFFCMIQVAVLYLCTPVLLLYGSNSDNAAVQALFLSLAILVVIWWVGPGSGSPVPA